jgi:hypothetical protein
MTVVSLGALAWRGSLPVSREAIAWLFTAAVFSIGLAWRNSNELQALDFLATVAALLMAAAALNASRSALFAPRIRHTITAAVRAARTLVAGYPILVFHDAAATYDRGRWDRVIQRVVRVGAVVGVLTLVFGSLLFNADPIFASFVSLPNIDFPAFVRHAIVVAILTWGIGGWTRGALVEKTETTHRIAASPWQLGRLEITAAFITLIVLFTAFIVAQLGWLFGGEAFLRARTGLTAAAYARQGFFEMVLLVVLVIPVLVGTRAALRPGWQLARLHSRLALPVIALLAAIVLSAALRMQLYVRYFGLSTDRFYPLVFMAWLAFVLIWLAATTLRGRARRFGPGVVLSALATLGGLNVYVPDVVVARVNVARSRKGGPLDASYLTRLSGEAADAAVLALLADAQRLPVPQEDVDRCASLKRLLGRWGSESSARARSLGPGAWRSWNAGERNALAVVAAHEVGLQRIRSDACARAESVARKR